MSTFVYTLYDGTEVLYIGVADDVTARLKQHAEKPWFADVTAVGAREHGTREQALQDEARSITLLRPRYNRSKNPNHIAEKITLPPIVYEPYEPNRVVVSAPAVEVTATPTSNRLTALKGKRRYVSLAEAAEYVGVCTRSLRRWIAAGRLPAHRVGPRLIKIDLNELDMAIDSFGKGFH